MCTQTVRGWTRLWREERLSTLKRRTVVKQFIHSSLNTLSTVVQRTHKLQRQIGTVIIITQDIIVTIIAKHGTIRSIIKLITRVQLRILTERYLRPALKTIPKLPIANEPRSDLESTGTLVCQGMPYLLTNLAPMTDRLRRNYTSKNLQLVASLRSNRFRAV